MPVKILALMLMLSAPVSAETIQGRWKLIAAEDLRADGSVARYPWGRHPLGSIVVEGGACYLQIMSGDVPTIGTPFASSASASLSGVWPPYCTITPTGFSLSTISSTSSSVNGSK